MQASINELLHLKLEGEIAELVVKVEPSYAKFVTWKCGKTVIYAQLSKALNGTLHAAVLFWQDLSNFLIDELGFTINHYDWIVVKKEMDRKQCTIGWVVNDLKYHT